MTTSRRRFFGLMAAPAIIGISGKMQMWVPAPLVAASTPFTTANMDIRVTEKLGGGLDDIVRRMQTLMTPDMFIHPDRILITGYDGNNVRVRLIDRKETLT